MEWIRETKIRTFMELELEACLDEMNWMIRCHNCKALNCPQEEYPTKPLPIPPDYIDNLQSRLINNVKNGILPYFLKMILKTYYHPPACQALTTSPSVQSDDMMGRHRDGEHNPLERPRASEEEENVVADGTSSTDKGGCFVSRTEVGMDHEPSQVAARHLNWRCFSNNNGQQRRAQIGGRLPHSSRLRGKHEYSYKNTSRHPREGCDWPAPVRDGVD